MTANKELCSLAGVGTSTFQDRMAVAIRRAGGQSALARKISERYGIKVSAQRIQYLANKKAKKPARGSNLTPQIAAVSGLRAEWLASEEGEQDVAGATVVANGSRQHKPVIDSTGTIEITVRETGEMRRIEMTQDAIDVAIMFMALPQRERGKFKRTLTATAVQYMDQVPDEQLGHLAAPGTPTAKRYAKAKAKTSKHSN